MPESQNYEFRGWLGLDKDCIEKGTLEEREFTPKPFGDSDVDIKITHCGICGSDAYILRGGWGGTLYPVCGGHEIVGTAAKVGKDVKSIKVGDRVGVGAQSCCCMRPSCPQCTTGNQQYCAEKVDTYNSVYPDGSKAMGGYGDYARVHEHFVFKIPDGLSSEIAAPMLCAGVTMYSPLKRNGAGAGKTVGIIGIGGLGHYGLLWSKLLGADKVVAISRFSSKADDAHKLGADTFIATEEDPKWAENNANSIDLIVCTAFAPKMPIGKYLQLLKPHGTYVQVGAPEDEISRFSMFPLLTKAVKICGSMIGSPDEINEMLDLAASKGVRSWVNLWPMSKINEAMAAFMRGEPRYRIVLANEKHIKD